MPILDQTFEFIAVSVKGWQNEFVVFINVELKIELNENLLIFYKNPFKGGLIIRSNL